MNVHVALGKLLEPRCGNPLMKKEVAVIVTLRDKITIEMEGATRSKRTSILEKLK
jgi:hypothetical protein